MTRRKKMRNTKITTVVGAETEVMGDVRFVGGLHVDGHVKGSVCAVGDQPSLLMVSESGVIEGDIRVGNLLLNGKVVGDVYVNGILELASDARVSGNVYYSLLEMARGAEVNGQLMCSSDLAPLNLDHDGAQPAVSDRDASGADGDT